MKLLAVPVGHVTSKMPQMEGTPPNPVMAFIIQTAGETVLFDTGMHPHVREDAVAYWGGIARRHLVPVLPDEADVVSRLEAAGIAPKNVTLVINSHLHNDHAGMNRFFPDSRILVRQREWDHAITVMDDNSSGFVRNDFYDDNALPDFFDYESECDLLGNGVLTLVSTPGHTPGHQCLKITFPSGARHILSGDAVYSAGQLDTGDPPAITWDRDVAVESVKRLAGLRDSGASVHVCHDPGEWNGVEKVQTVYEET